MLIKRHKPQTFKLDDRVTCKGSGAKPYRVDAISYLSGHARYHLMDNNGNRFVAEAQDLKPAPACGAIIRRRTR